MLRNLNQGMTRLDKFQRQLATNKRVLVPSDDPASVANIMGLKGSLLEVGQHIENVDYASSWLESSNTVLDSVTNVLHRLRELTIYGANDSLDESDRVALENEVNQLFDNMVQLANSTHGGKYLFGGQKTTTVPFEVIDGKVVYEGGSGEYGSITVELGPNAEIDMNVTGIHETFLEVFDVLSSVKDSLKDNDIESLGNKDLEGVENSLNSLLRHRSETGAKTNRLEMAKERLLDQRINFTDLLTKEQAIDVAETIMHLKAQENIYRTALAVGARILQPSLVDFLR